MNGPATLALALAVSLSPQGREVLGPVAAEESADGGSLRERILAAEGDRELLAEISMHWARGEPPEGAAPAVRTLLLDEDDWVRTWACVLLANLDRPDSRAGEAELFALLESGDPVEVLAGTRAARCFPAAMDRTVPLLAASLAAEDPELARAGAFALGGLLPAALPHLLHALDHADDRVRVLAAEGLERSLWPHQVGPDHQDFEAYRMWHGLRYGEVPPSSCVWELASTGPPVFERSLCDPVEEVRVFTALSLYKLGALLPFLDEERREPLSSCMPALKRAGEDDSLAVRTISGWALARLEADEWTLLERSMRRWRERTDGAVPALPAEERERLVAALRSGSTWELGAPGYTPGLAFPSDPDEVWEAGRELLVRDGPRLFAELRGSDPEAAEVAQEILAEIRFAVGRHAWDLLLIAHDEWEPGPASRELASFGPEMPSIAWEFLRFPRFPKGPGMYDSLYPVLSGWEAESTPIWIEALEHWTEWGRAKSAAELARIGPEAAVAAPLIVSAWRMESVDPRAPGTDSFWDLDRSPWDAGAAFRGHCMAALGAGTVPYLVAALRDESSLVRARACRALGALAAEADVALPALRVAGADPRQRVRAAAAAAIEALEAGAGPEQR